MIEVWNNTIHTRELENFGHAVADRNIMEGPVLKVFEERIKKLLKADYVIGTSSGSAALALAFMGIGIAPGDEVIVPDLTFIATANAAHLLGAEVIVAPVKENQTLLDENAVEEYVTDKTKAIVTVDLNGRIACSKMLREKYAKRGIYIVDDACQAFMAHGNDGSPAGAYADITCYSFGITKMVTTVMGGLVATNRKEIYEKMKIMKTQGMPSVFEGDTYMYPGFNFKLPDVLAAIGMGQLDCLNDKMQHMLRINRMYRENLIGIAGISFLERKEGEHPWMTDIICENRDKVRRVLADHEISSRPLGAPLHSANYLRSKGEYMSSVIMSKKMLYLPGGPDQDIENVEKVIRVLKSNDLR
ncbi:MAG: aminotransferase class I/II-fold pyridoxal phosphate-dependent enzyme [Lachnospiraceae bacterium]|nr:aminotransferase class I/II-fold pyridoxal phosphate-dependent enzyme [Lachnospiraceae bacterium]